MKKILVPTDFSKTSINAVEVAVEIAKKSNADITLLHVVEEASSSSFSVTGEWQKEDWADKLYTIKLLEKSKAQLEKLVLDPRFSDVKITGELRIGNAFHGMRTIITEHKVDLVVMGTSGRSGAVDSVIGTNTERVVRHAKCPVLSINKKPSKVNFKNIVYATAMHKDEEVFSRMVRRHNSYTTQPYTWCVLIHLAIFNATM
jgi:nucleotide-binding universal stress UspA family protein